MSQNARAIVQRLSILCATLLALFALYRMEGRPTSVAIWTALVVLSAILPYRIPDTAVAVWMLRIPLIGLAILLNLSNSVEVVNVYDSKTMAWLGDISAAEMVRAAWTRANNDESALRPLWLSGMVMLAASCTEDAIMTILTPFYFLALLVGIRMGGSSVWRQRRVQLTVPWRFGLAVGFALLAGAGLSALITYEKNALTAWGMSLLGERRVPENGSLSLNPTLTSTFGQRGSLTRVLRVEGRGEFTHLRGAAFTTYSFGSWGPRLTALTEEPISNELEPIRPGQTVRVTRLLNNRGLIFAPLNANGLHFEPGTPLARIKERGDMIRTTLTAPTQYKIDTSANEDFQGPLCRKPTKEEIVRLLTVPNEIDPAVHQLCAKIIAHAKDPRSRIEAIEHYLTTNHHYSLRVRIGPGDPVSFFLLQRKDAHCEFFASAAAILSRIAGVPSRYVIGYLAHETEPDGSTIVRQRDAHAWAECWIEGTGWVVLDATPGDGRPDALTDKPSPLERLVERFQDWITELRLGLHRDTIIKVMIAAAVLFLIVVSIRGIWNYARRSRRTGGDASYTDSSAELAALFRDFERACRRCGLICPPGKTWTEYLSERANDSGNRLPSQMIESAMAFTLAYNRERFGPDTTSAGLAPLRELLATVRQSPKHQSTDTTELRSE